MAIVSAGNFSIKRSRGLVDSLVSVAAEICHCGVSVATPRGDALCCSRASFVEQVRSGLLAPALTSS